jgi:hypothetical protein
MERLYLRSCHIVKRQIVNSLRAPIERMTGLFTDPPGNLACDS